MLCMTRSVRAVRESRLPTNPEESMAQLRLAHVNLRLLNFDNRSRAMKPSSPKSESSPANSLPLLALKAARLHELKPGAAAVIERIVDSLLIEAEGRKL